MKLHTTFIKSGKIFFFLRCYFFLIFIVPFVGIPQAVATGGGNNEFISSASRYYLFKRHPSLA